MAKSPAKMLRETIGKVIRHTAMEWELTPEEVIGAIEIAKLDVWNRWEDYASDGKYMEPPHDDDDD